MSVRGAVRAGAYQGGRARARAARAGTVPAAGAGYALIELIVAIVVIAIAVGSVLGVLSASAVSASRALVREQAVQIATAYLNEIESKAFNDPLNGVGETRSQYVGVNDYNGLVNIGPTDATGTAVPGVALAGFTVSVAVSNVALGSVPAAQSERIDVTVQHAGGVSVALSGYRTNHL